MEDKKPETYHPDPMFNDPPEPMSAKEGFKMLGVVLGMAAAIFLILRLLGVL